MHSSIWKNILLKMTKLNPIFLNLINLLQVRIGDGDSTRFWEDNWSELGILKNHFPRLFALEDVKGISVKNRINIDLEDWS